MPTYAFDPSRMSDSQKRAFQQKYPLATNIYSSQSPLRPPGNVFFGGQSFLRPSGDVPRSFEDRAEQYQQEAAEFNLGQKEAELEKRRAGVEEIASGRNMLNGRAVTRAEMDQYLQSVEQSGAKARAEFDRENPFYASIKASMPRAPQPDQFSNDQDYQSAISEYLSPANKRAREQEFIQKLNQSRRNSLTNSINQFRNDPMGYLLGGGREGSSTYSPDQLMSYLGQANQLFKATGQEGNFMDFLLGNSSTGQGKAPRSQGNFQFPSLRDRDEYRLAQAQDLARRKEEKRKARLSYTPSNIKPIAPSIIRNAFDRGGYGARQGKTT